MTAEEFCELHPKLYHMATSGSLEQIKRHGLLSTKAIVELLEVPREAADRLTRARRPAMTPLTHPTHGAFALRDQKPMSDKALIKCLEDMTPPEWYSTLNSRVFLWANKDRLERMAHAYRKVDRLILEIDSRPLIQNHFKSVQVSTINSGSTIYKAVKRGTKTFIDLPKFALSHEGKPIAEVTVMRAIPRFYDYVVDATIRKAEG